LACEEASGVAVRGYSDPRPILSDASACIRTRRDDSFAAGRWL